MSGFVIRGLDPAPFAPLFGLSDADLAERGVVRVVANESPGFPCRVTLEDAAPGEPLLLVNFEHLPVANPYRSRYAIFVREGATEAAEYHDTVPEQLACRLLSVRGFDGRDMLHAAEVVEGSELEPLIGRLFSDPAVAYLHVHNAKPGCFAARIDRG